MLAINISQYLFLGITELSIDCLVEDQNATAYIGEGDAGRKVRHKIQIAKPLS
jgi:hypothetical protein